MGYLEAPTKNVKFQKQLGIILKLFHFHVKQFLFSYIKRLCFGRFKKFVFTTLEIFFLNFVFTRLIFANFFFAHLLEKDFVWKMFDLTQELMLFMKFVSNL